MIKMEFNIQRFGGRGANSSPRKESIFIVENNESKRITFNNLKKGDTFKIDTPRGVYNMTLGSKMNLSDGYLAEGHLESGEKGTYLTTLVTDKRYEEADETSKRFMVPLSKTGSWRRK